MTQSELPPPPPFKKKGRPRTAATQAEEKHKKSKSILFAVKQKRQRVDKLIEKLEAEVKQESKVASVLKGTSFKNVLETTDLSILGDDLLIEEALDKSNIIFAPNVGPQTTFLASTEREVLYGGAAGGGKTLAMLIDPMRYFDNPNHRGLILRRTNDELREIIGKSKEIYKQAYPGAAFKEQASTWFFPSGATHWMTYLDRDDDVTRYQGQAFNWIGFDELSQWPTQYAWNYMRSRLRTTDPSLPLIMRASCNPGGLGGWWVRKMFIDPAQWGDAFWATDIEKDKVLTYPKGHDKEGQPLFKRRFIPAKLTDNPHLFADGEYEANLLSLPEVQRRRLLEGDWDVVEGAAFEEFNRNTHVVPPFDIPDHWYRFRGADWGRSSPGCVLWFAVTPDNELIIYREWYFKGLDADQVGYKVLEMEQGDYIPYGILDVSAWSKRGDVGPSIAETMNKIGCRWRPSGRITVQGARNSRISGKLEVHRRLSIDPLTDKPRMVIFNTCVNLIRTLPALPLDKNDPEDVDTDAEDHAYDALRYGCMSRPIKSTPTRITEWGEHNLGKWRPASNTFGY